MNQSTRYILILALGVFAGVGISFEQFVFAERKGAGQSLPLEDLQVFAEVFGKIKSDYVEEVDDKELLQDAIQGMLSGLDPHSSYLDPESFKEVRIGTEGQFGGLGIEVTMENGFVKVVAPIDDTPAHRAGVQAGDLIIRLDNTPVKGMSLDEAVRMMRGDPGDEIVLTIVRDGESKPLELAIERAVIRITSVKNRILDDGYGYIRITQFQAGTDHALREKLTLMKEEVGGPLKGLILDLRNNPGGVLSGAVAVSDTFLRSGTIVYTKGRGDDSELRFNTTPTDYADGVPMIVLVNGGSASASEIVAGALQDHKRAIIMGTKTFGKGSVQTILPMQNGAALKITTARYYTPSDRSIQATGIQPDVIVEDLKLAKKDDDTNSSLREADLAGHLDNEKDAAKEPSAAKNSGIALLTDDYQLREALNLLKGVNIVRASDGS
ncbi:MAG: S41 family peptidase [Gammaproteobacteria bacterium]|nr:S41 family peptidase [Gammaproteobacteria bacterium]